HQDHRLVRTPALAARLFELIDDLDEWPRWNAGIASMELNGGFAPGERGTLTTNRGMRVCIRCRAYDDPRYIALDERRALYVIERTMTLQPEGEATWVNLQLRYRGPNGLIGGLIGHSTTKQQMAVSLRALKRLTEALPVA
ncbi:MAG: SRPBCC family protein, partial [Pseudomonadota bacterium]